MSSAELGHRIRCYWQECDAEFHDLCDLVAHLNDFHIGTRRGDYTCEWTGCGRRGVVQASRFSLIAHLRSHTGERPFDCPIPECDKSFTRSDALAKHMKQQHADFALVDGVWVRESRIPSVRTKVRIPTIEDVEDPVLYEELKSAGLALRQELSTALEEFRELTVERDALLDAVLVLPQPKALLPRVVLPSTANLKSIMSFDGSSE